MGQARVELNVSACALQIHQPGNSWIYIDGKLYSIFSGELGVDCPYLFFSSVFIHFFLFYSYFLFLSPFFSLYISDDKSCSYEDLQNK